MSVATTRKYMKSQRTRLASLDGKHLGHQRELGVDAELFDTVANDSSVERLGTRIATSDIPASIIPTVFPPVPAPAALTPAKLHAHAWYYTLEFSLS